MTKEAMIFLAQTSKIITISYRIVKSNSNFGGPVFSKSKHHFASRTTRRAPVNQPNDLSECERNVSQQQNNHMTSTTKRLINVNKKD
jgi:hypothetical protein